MEGDSSRTDYLGESSTVCRQVHILEHDHTFPTNYVDAVLKQSVLHSQISAMVANFKNNNKSLDGICELADK